MPVKDPVLEINNLTKKFGGLTAVNDFNFNLPKDGLYGLIGPNGAGKTTIFNMITGVYKPTEGDIKFKGDIISNLRPDKITHLGIARTFQNIRLFSEMSVLENVLVAQNLRRRTYLFESIFYLPRYKEEEAKMYDIAWKFLESVELTKVANEKSDSLPYGMQRRLEIVRALATEPDVLLLDEPGAGMNPGELKSLMDFILKIRDEFNLTILLIEHHMKLVMGICEFITVLNFGETIATGKPDEIQSNDKVIEAYLGGGISNA